MAATVELSDGTTSVNLNDGTNYKYRSIEIEPGEVMAVGSFKESRRGLGNYAYGPGYRKGRHPRFYTHQSPSLILTIMVMGTSHDNMMTNWRAIEAMLRKARDYFEENSTKKVTLELKLPDSTNSVFYHIANGRLDPGEALFDHPSTISETVMDAELTLVVYEQPYGATRTLKNYITSDRLNTDADSDGVADSWSEAYGTGMAPTYSINNSAQKIAVTGGTATSGNASVRQIITLSATDLVVGDIISCKADAQINNATNFRGRLSLSYYNSGGTIISEVDSDLTTSGTAAWTSVQIDGSTIPASTASIYAQCRARRDSGGTATQGTAWWKNVMLERASACSDEYISSCVLKNHYDSGAGDINYIDIEGIKGEAEAPAKIYIHSQSGGIGTYWAAQRSRPTLTDFDWFLDSGDAASGSYAGTADATVIGGSYNWKSHTTGGTFVAGRWDLSSAWESYRGSFRVFARVWQGGTTNTAMQYRVKTVYYEDSAWRDAMTGKWTPSAGGSIWHILDLGVMHLPVQQVPLGSTVTYNHVQVEARRPGSGTVESRMDAAILFPVDESSGYGTYLNSGNIAADGYVVFDDIADPPVIFNAAADWDYIHALDGDGAITLQPGANRLYFMRQDTVDSMVIDDTFAVTVDYVPMFETLA